MESFDIYNPIPHTIRTWDDLAYYLLSKIDEEFYINPKTHNDHVSKKVLDKLFDKAVENSSYYITKNDNKIPNLSFIKIICHEYFQDTEVFYSSKKKYDQYIKKLIK